MYELEPCSGFRFLGTQQSGTSDQTGVKVKTCRTLPEEVRCKGGT